MRLQRSILYGFTLALACAPAAPIHAQNRLTASQQAQRSADDVRYPCRDVHTFDFWVGTFDATPWNQPTARPTGQLHNTREYEGCVIVERWNSVQGPSGMSMAFYDNNRHLWRMIWNDDANRSNDLEGSYSDGAMRFTGWVLDRAGKRLVVSNVLQNVSPDIIRHTYSISPDNGKTWVVKSDGRFVRRQVADGKQ